MKKKNPTTTKSIIETDLSLYNFKDGKSYFVYCPQLNLTGYGKTETEARKSYKIVLNSYLDFTNENQTLIEDLKNHGWKTDRKTKKMIPPAVTDLIEDNPELKEILNDRTYNSEKQKLIVTV